MDAALHPLIGLIYEAALEPSRWSAFLQAYADAVEAASAVLLYHDVREHRGAISTSVGVDPEALQEYGEHYVAIDPWLYSTEALGRLKSGVIIVGEEVAPHAEFTRTEYYNDFAKGYGLTRVLSAVIRRDGNVTSSISTLRPDSREPFSERERSVLRILLPHLYRAMQVHRRIVSLEAGSTALLDALDRMPIGVIVARGDGRVAFANHAANDVLEQCDGLVSSHNGLRASDAAQNRALLALLHAAATTSAGTGTDGGGAISLSRSSVKAPLAVLVTPLRARSMTGLGDRPGMAALFVTDPERTVQADAEVIRQFWGLTPTEAAIAVRLAAGQSIADIAGQLQTADGTVRWHVKRVLSKTDTKRQSDLVRVLTTGPAVLRRCSPQA